MKKAILLILFVFSNITSAQIIDVVTGIHWPNQMEIVGDELYFIEYGAHNILKINITDPTPDPILVYNTGYFTMDIKIQGDRLFYTIASGNTIYEIDLSDPTPTAIELVTGLVATDGLLLNGSDLYVSERWPGSKVLKVNINDPNPSLELVVEIGSPRQLWLEGDLLYIGANDGEQIMKININDPNPIPELVVNPAGTTSDLMVYEDEIYVSYFFEDKISTYNAIDGLEAQINQDIDAPTGMLVIGEFLYFSQYNANKISKVDVGLLPLILGISDIDLKEITIHPNPAKDFLYIDSQVPIDSVSIYSLTGSLIKQTSNSNINVADLTKGLYFVKVSIEGRTITKKFIKS